MIWSGVFDMEVLNVSADLFNIFLIEEYFIMQQNLSEVKYCLRDHNRYFIYRTILFIKLVTSRNKILNEFNGCENFFFNTHFSLPILLEAYFTLSTERYFGCMYLCDQYQNQIHNLLSSPFFKKFELLNIFSFK